MLTHFHKMILRMLPGPFFGWLGTLMFLLLMQFLIRYLPDIVGKGLPIRVILELIVYNLAYMMVLAVPMSVLIATIMTFGRLGETKMYAVMKTAGASLPQIMWPVVLVGFGVVGAMLYFNNVVLPEANFRAKNLWTDIRRKKPGFELQEGVFYEGINHYSILVQRIPEGSNDLYDVTIYDYTDGSRDRVDIKAQRGRIEPIAGGAYLDLVLEDGEVHRLLGSTNSDYAERYERLAFDRHRLRLDLTDFAFERSDPRTGYRSDRTMRTDDMIAYVDSLEDDLGVTRRELLDRALAVGADTSLAGAAQDQPPGLPSVPEERTAATASDRLALSGVVTVEEQRAAYEAAMTRARRVRSAIENAERTLGWEQRRADRFRVEIHKKQSIALACVIFILVAAPLGLSIRRGGMGAAAAWTVGIFLFFWVTLVQGEKLADRELIDPWLGMWAANLVTGTAGLWLILYVTFDLGATPRLRRRLRRWRTGRTDRPLAPSS